MIVRDDRFCFVCGKENPYGLQLRFDRSGEKIVAEFTPSGKYQGYSGITHGGIISSVLDEAMIYAALTEEMTPITAELTIRFKRTLNVNEKAIVKAEVTKRTSRLIEAYSCIVRQEDNTLSLKGSQNFCRC